MQRVYYKISIFYVLLAYTFFTFIKLIFEKQKESISFFFIVFLHKRGGQQLSDYSLPDTKEEEIILAHIFNPFRPLLQGGPGEEGRLS